MSKDRSEWPVIAVLNMKGGVGKTTVTANVMRHMYRTIKGTTWLIDFDPQYNLTQLLLQQTIYDLMKANNKTILSVMESDPQPSLLSVTNGSVHPPTGADVSTRLRYMKDESAELRLVPGDFGLVKYSLIDQAHNTLTPVRDRFRRFIKTLSQDGVVCIDCNPSSSFLTITALEVATHVLVPVKPDRFSMLGLDMLNNFVNQQHQLEDKPKFVVLLNDIPRSNYDPIVEDQLRAHPIFGSRTLSAQLHQSKALSANQRHTGFASDRRGPYVRRALSNIEDVAAELRRDLGI
ncbi:ParA family protein [Xanthomonas campestris]|uniref:ParA family protein n=1 Tax=Xanthomonas campestris TaxID=339 RepID=UPI001C865C7A|nr:ParA family protein [Xanthomonas campestris]MCC5051993.1 ParA family protein [Xanthomonas campestris pv. aberrans]MDM7683148.1 ParA family protein [Xanthomonas campestris pv. campestris]MDM7710474.1 ParA family protein [Xanthomonas campestris pv. campestris]MDO0858529.1 ParA family protein [Xanthomonas campestris pv. campestris]MEA9472467.1 ParA family protein [Xanthomonas campestris]